MFTKQFSKHLSIFFSKNATILSHYLIISWKWVIIKLWLEKQIYSIKAVCIKALVWRFFLQHSVKNWKFFYHSDFMWNQFVQIVIFGSEMISRKNPISWKILNFPLCISFYTFIGHVQCENDRNFLPLRFYVQWISVN